MSSAPDRERKCLLRFESSQDKMLADSALQAPGTEPFVTLAVPANEAVGSVAEYGHVPNPTGAPPPKLLTCALVYGSAKTSPC